MWAASALSLRFAESLGIDMDVGGTQMEPPSNSAVGMIYFGLTGIFSFSFCLLHLHFPLGTVSFPISAHEKKEGFHIPSSRDGQSAKCIPLIIVIGSRMAL